MNEILLPQTNNHNKYIHNLAKKTTSRKNCVMSELGMSYEQKVNLLTNEMRHVCLQ